MISQNGQRDHESNLGLGANRLRIGEDVLRVILLLDLQQAWVILTPVLCRPSGFGDERANQHKTMIVSNVQWLWNMITLTQRSPGIHQNCRRAWLLSLCLLFHSDRRELHPEKEEVRGHRDIYCTINCGTSISLRNIWWKCCAYQCVTLGIRCSIVGKVADTAPFKIPWMFC